MWPASMLIYLNKRKHLYEKKVQLPQDWFRTPTWPPFHCFGTPIWQPWRHVKMLYKHICCSSFFISVNFVFPFVLNSLAYITIPQNNGKIKINCNKKLTTTYTLRLCMFKACLHGGGGPQVGEVTHLGGITRLSIYSLFSIDHVYMIGRVTRQGG